MTTFKRAYLYITRKKVRSIIMFMLLTIISTVLLSSNILNHTVKGISNKIYESSNFGFTVKNLSKTDKEISVKKLDKITNLPDIKGANYQFATPVNLLGSKVVEGQNNLILDEKTNKNNLVMLNANTNTADNSDFKSEVLKLKKGKHIGPEDRNKVLVHEEFAKLKRIVEITREGSQTLKELPVNAAIYFEDKFELPVIEEGMNKKERKSIERLTSSLETETGKKSIQMFIEKINKLNEEISEDEAKQILHELQDEIGEGPAAVLMPLRAVITGKARGADLYTVIAVIGKERTLARINNILNK